MIRECWASILEELNAMNSGKFVPYHKTAVMVAAVVALLFSLVFRHTTIFEAPIAVVDLDASRYSTELIQRINTSPYIRVATVLKTPTDPEQLTQHDFHLGVLYIPKGLEKAVKTGRESVTLGYLADYSNSAQNAQIMSELNAYVPQAGAEIGAVTVSALGLGEQKTEAAMSPLKMTSRELFNPTSTATNGLTIGFVYFFSSLFFGLTVLMVPGRLRAMNVWERTVLARSPAAILARGIPYSLFYVTGITLITALLATFGQLRFAGNYFAYLPSLFMTGLAFSWLGLVLAWGAPNAGAGASRMIFLVPPGFIMGGYAMATGYLPNWAYGMSYLFPLTWQYRFWRDFACRGAPVEAMAATYGAYLFYLAAIAAIVVMLWHIAVRNEGAPEAESLQTETA